MAPRHPHSHTSAMDIPPCAFWFQSKQPQTARRASSDLLEAMGRYNGELAEAVEWVKHSPNPMPGPSQIEIRLFYEYEDFGEALPAELREQEEGLREELEGR